MESKVIQFDVCSIRSFGAMMEKLKAIPLEVNKIEKLKLLFIFIIVEI